MRPTIVKDIESLKLLDGELRKAGDTVVWRDDFSFTVYRNGRPVKFVKVGES